MIQIQKVDQLPFSFSEQLTESSRTEFLAGFNVADWRSMQTYLGFIDDRLVVAWGIATPYLLDRSQIWILPTIHLRPLDSRTISWVFSGILDGYPMGFSTYINEANPQAQRFGKFLGFRPTDKVYEDENGRFRYYYAERTGD